LFTNVTWVPGLTVRFLGLTPLDVIVMIAGVDAVVVTVTSFEASLVPHAFRALTRMEYVPAASVTVAFVGALETTVVAEPPEVAASITYPVGEPELALHDSVTVVPDTDAVNPPGADGTGQAGAAIVNVTSLEAGLVPQALTARTRAK
jgi:hypothetical protein